MPIGVQGYTVRFHTFNKDQVESAYKRISDMGYDGVEASLGRRFMSVEEDLAMLAKYNLKTCDAYGDISKPDEAMEIASQYGVKILGMPAISGDMLCSSDGFKVYADKMNEMAKPFEGTGFRLQYHNHAQEFRNFPDMNGKPGMAILIENTNPDTICFELDTFWVSAAGGDPVQWIRKVNGRIPIVHFKDYAVDHRHIDVGMGFIPYRYAEIGQGNLNWPAIVEACRESGVEWYCVEQDRTILNAFECLGISIQYMRGLGIK